MRQVRLDTVRRGEFIKRTATSNKVYIRGDYKKRITNWALYHQKAWSRKAPGRYYYGRYSCIDTEDANREIFLRGDHMVFVGFTY